MQMQIFPTNDKIANKGPQMRGVLHICIFIINAPKVAQTIM